MEEERGKRGEGGGEGKRRRKGGTSTHCVTSVMLSRCHERTVPSSEQETTHEDSG